MVYYEASMLRMIKIKPCSPVFLEHGWILNYRTRVYFPSRSCFSVSFQVRDEIELKHGLKASHKTKTTCNGKEAAKLQLACRHRYVKFYAEVARATWSLFLLGNWLRKTCNTDHSLTNWHFNLFKLNFIQVLILVAWIEWLSRGGIT